MTRDLGRLPVRILPRARAPIEILTGGAPAVSPSICGWGSPESVFAFSVNVVALLGAFYFVREKYA